MIRKTILFFCLVAGMLVFQASKADASNKIFYEAYDSFVQNAPELAWFGDLELSDLNEKDQEEENTHRYLYPNPFQNTHLFSSCENYTCLPAKQKLHQQLCLLFTNLSPPLFQ